LNIEYPFVDESEGIQVDYQDESQWGNLGSSLRWARKWNQRWFTNAIGSYSTYSSFLNARDRTTDLNFGIKDSTLTDRSGDLAELSLKFESELSFLKHTVGLGVWSTYQEVHYTSKSSDGDKASLFESAATLALYIQDEINIRPNLSANVGARLSYYDGNKQTFLEPRIAGEWQLHERFSLKVGIGRYTQAIRRIRRQNLFLNTPDFWRLSNGANIPVLVSDQWQIGFQIPSNKWIIDVEYYERYLNGVVADPLQYSFEVRDQLSDLWTGTGQIRGVDIMLQRTVGRHTGWISATISKAVEQYNEVKQEEVYTPSDQRLELNTVYLVRFPHWTITATGVFGSGRPTTPLIGYYNLELLNGSTTTVPVRGAINSARLPAYHRLDLAARYNFVLGSGQAEFGVSIFNVYDRKNVRETQYYLSQNSDASLVVDEKQLYYLGIMPAISFTITY
jgi:ferric enterobactin receptor